MGIIKRIGLSRVVIVVVACVAIYCLFRKAKGVRGTSDRWIGCDWRTTFPQAFRPINDTPTTVSHKGDSSGELACRRHLETKFKASFPKQRPDFLRNPITNQQLELDCYNSSMRLAVEYQGEQHYKYIPHFHPTRDSFLNQKYRDEIKRDLCQKNNIILIEVPHSVIDIAAFLDLKLGEHGFL
jgi:hypothetical protein